MIFGLSTPRCFRKDEHGETLLSKMRYLFEEVGVISSPSTHRSARLWTSPRRYRSSSQRLQRPYGGYATAYVLAVLMYTQIATSAWRRSDMKREIRKVQPNAMQHNHSNMNVHQKFEPLGPSPSSAWKIGEHFLLARSKLRYSINVLLGHSTVSKAPSFYLSETTILVLAAPSPFHLCLDSSARALDLKDLRLSLPCRATDPSHMGTMIVAKTRASRARSSSSVPRSSFRGLEQSNVAQQTSARLEIAAAPFGEIQYRAIISLSCLACSRQLRDGYVALRLRGSTHCFYFGCPFVTEAVDSIYGSLYAWLPGESYREKRRVEG
jgi:hypothetical protein